MGALKPSFSTVNAVLFHNRSPRKLKIWKRMSTCFLADSFNDKKMVTASDMELTTRQKNDNCLPLFTRKMVNPNSNNNNNSGGVFDNIEDARNRRHSANVSFNHSPPSSISDSAHIKQENISANGEFSNNQIARGFIDSDLLDVHGKRFGCEHCGNSFTDPSNLQRHIRQHHAGARAHPCPECGKTFATSSGLKQHQHIHSSVKPFICEVCHKSYTQFSNLCRHKRMHADCRIRIKCANCGDFFPTSSALGKHRRFCDASSVFSNGSTINERGSAPVNAERISDNKICQSPPQLLRNCFSHLPRTSMLDWSFGSNPASDRTLREIDPSSRYMPYFFPNRLVTSGLHHNQREANVARTKSFDRCEISPASSTSSHSRSVRILKEASVQCNDPLVDCIQMTLKKNRSEVPNILQADSSRFRRVDRSVHYSPTLRHAETQVQLSPMHSPTLSPVYPDGTSSSGLRQRSDLIGDARYCAPNPFTAPSSLRPPKISDVETNAFARAGLKDNFKQMLDEMIARQRFFNLASAFATVPNLYGVGPFSTNGKIPGYPSHPYLPRYSSDSEQPLDLSLNGLRDAFATSGLARTAETLSSKLPVTPRMQGLGSPAKNSEVGSPETPQIKSSPPWYQPYGVLRNDPNLMKLYGGMNASLPLGKINGTPMPYPMAFRPTMGNAQHPPMLSPSQMFSMVNSQRRMYDMIQRDCADLSGRSAPQQSGPERSPASNYNGISRCYGSPGHLGGRGSGRFEREKYVCKYCGKLFPRSANLTRHLRTHTGEQPYSCKYCDRNFSISSNLQRHVRNIHKKERPYCCPLCKRAFGQQTNLERHLRKHLEKPDSLRRTNLTQDFRDYGESKNPSHGVDEVKDRSSLSPKNSSDDRDLNTSPDWNEEHSSKNGFQTSSDDDSEDAVLRKSVSFSSTRQESLERHIGDENDSLNIVSSDE